MDKRLIDLLACDYWIPNLCPECGGNVKIAHNRSKDNHVCREKYCMDCGYKFESIEILKNPLPE